MIADLRIISWMLTGRLNLLLSQLPGRFWAPRSIDPSASITPGQPIPMKGASSFVSSQRQQLSLEAFRQAD